MIIVFEVVIGIKYLMRIDTAETSLGLISPVQTKENRLVDRGYRNHLGLRKFSAKFSVKLWKFRHILISTKRRVAKPQ